MLTPTVRLCKEHSICTCGNPNFRTFNSQKPIYKVYEVIIPKAPCGEVTFHLCEDCIKKIWEALNDAVLTTT